MTLVQLSDIMLNKVTMGLNGFYNSVYVNVRACKNENVA